MVSFNPLALFKSSKQDSTNQTQNANPTFDPNTLTMVQPGSPSAPSMDANGIVSEQPGRQEQMNSSMQLRGGGGGGICCGV
ncbi:hypothetical protein BJX76DRAFT_353767 [Aspergillus varians]